jgi:hypothetical protein
MPTLKLTSLVDIVSKSGTPKATAVRDAKAQVDEPYDPAADFYKGIREAIVEAHQLALGKRHITNAAAAAHGKKIAAYTQLAAAYNGWWGRKPLTWSEPPRGAWGPRDSDFDVTVNPELGLDIDGTPHVVKLYFKAEPLSKNRIDIITHLMHKVFAEANPDSRFSVLDIRRRRLHTIDPPAELDAILGAEIAYVEALWPYV